MIFILSIDIIHPWQHGKQVKLTSKFGYRTLDKGREFHSGIDVVISDDIVTAAYDGVVKFCGQWTDEKSKTAGNVIVLNHYNQQNELVCETRYYHLNEILVSNGQKVKIGEKIGIQGYTGRVFPKNANGKHLHFGVKLANGNYLDPLELINMTGEVQELLGYKHWDETNFVQLNQNGVRWFERRPNDPLTRAEARSLQVRKL